MKQIKIIQKRNLGEFEKNINDFLEFLGDDEIYDIKYTVCVVDKIDYHSVIIIFKER